MTDHAFWQKRDGSRVHVTAMADEHIRNAIALVRRNARTLPKDEGAQEYARTRIETLEAELKRRAEPKVIAAEAQILELALSAMDDECGAPVLGDAVLEHGWFDPRVMQVLWPLGPAVRNGYRTRKHRQRVQLERDGALAGYPEMFASFASAPTKAWARAIAAVLLFGRWQHGRWRLIWHHERNARTVRMHGDARVFMNGRELRDVTRVTWEER